MALGGSGRPAAWHFQSALALNEVLVSPWLRVQDAIDIRDEAVGNTAPVRRPFAYKKLYARGRLVSASALVGVNGQLFFNFSEDVTTSSAGVTSGTVHQIIGQGNIATAVGTPYTFVVPLYYGRHFRVRFVNNVQAYAAGELFITCSFEEDA